MEPKDMTKEQIIIGLSNALCVEINYLNKPDDRVYALNYRLQMEAELLRRLDEADALRKENEELRKDCADMYDILVKATFGVEDCMEYGEYIHREVLTIVNVYSVREIFKRVAGRLGAAKVNESEKLKTSLGRIGTKVRKIKGCPFEGEIRAYFTTAAGLPRIVVDNGYGMLHIFNNEQMEVVSKESEASHE